MTFGAFGRSLAATGPMTKKGASRNGSIMSPGKPSHEAWALDCIRLLAKPIDSPTATPRGSDLELGVRTVSRTVVLNQLGTSESPLATLIFDFLVPGAGQVFQHPEFTLHTCAAEDFSGSLYSAFAAARTANTRDGQPPLCDLRWRLVGADGAVKCPTSNLSCWPNVLTMAVSAQSVV